MNTLFLLLAGLCLVVGAVGIANSTVVSLLERVPEIGLRRALGASRAQIATQFLAETTALGALGGTVGSALGVISVVIVTAHQEWTTVLPPWVLLVSPVLGAVTGLMAGIYPSVKAARIQPIDALRS